MARTAPPPFGDDKPGYIQITPEDSGFGLGGTGYSYIRTTGNPSGLEGIVRASTDDNAQSTSFNRRNLKIVASEYVLPPGTEMGLAWDVGGYTSDTGANISSSSISSAQTWPHFEAMKALFGEQSYGIVDAVNDSSASTTSFDVSTASSFEIGQGIWVNVNASAPSSYTWELAFIKDISSDTVTLRWPLSAVPANTAQIIGGTTFWPHTSNASSTLAMKWQGFTEAGESTGLYHLVRGMSGKTAVLSLPAEGPAHWEETLVCANGNQSTSSTALPVRPDWDYPGAEDLRGNLTVYRITTTDATDPTKATRTAIYPEGDITINIDMGTMQAPSAAATHGVSGQDVTNSACTVEFSLPRSAAALEHDNFEAQTIYGLQFVWGSSTGRTWCFYIPACQLEPPNGPTAGEVGALDQLTFTTIENNHSDGTTTGEGGNKPFYMFAG